VESRAPQSRASSIGIRWRRRRRVHDDDIDHGAAGERGMESMALHSPALSRSRLASYPRLSRSQSADAVYIRGYTFLLPDPLTLVPSSLSASMCTYLVLFLPSVNTSLLAGKKCGIRAPFVARSLRIVGTPHRTFWMVCSCGHDRIGVTLERSRVRVDRTSNLTETAKMGVGRK
jgi:hypothetical protein